MCKPWHPAMGGMLLRCVLPSLWEGPPWDHPRCPQQQPAHKFVSVDLAPSLVLVPVPSLCFLGSLPT